jgi:hypothetical protein
MVDNSQYLIRSTVDGYQVLKCDEDFNLVHSYTVLRRRGGLYCDCPYGQAPVHRRLDECRHVKMISLFKKEKAIDKGKFYCYASGTWTEA